MKARQSSTLKVSGRNAMALGLALVFAVTALVVGVPAPKASALGCRDSAITWYDPTEFVVGQGTTDRYVPWSYQSSCGDINIDKRYMSVVDGTPTVFPMFRVQYFPSSGGSYYDRSGWIEVNPYVNGPHDDPYNHNLVIVGDNVKNGTHYRIEVNQRASFHILD